MLDLDTSAAGLIARFLLGLTFMLSGVPKLLDRRSFAEAVGRFELLPWWTTRPLAALIPVAELAVGVLLLLGLYTRVAALTSMGMLAVFTGALTIAVMRGSQHDCNCFGRLPIKQHGWIAIGRNLLLIGLSVVALSVV